MTRKQEYQKEYYLKNKDTWNSNQTLERKREIMREYSHRNKEEVNARRNKWVEDHFEWNLWSQSKRRAKYNNLHWDLKVEDIVIPEICPYLGIKLTRIQGQGRQQTNASLDRIDSNKGYVKDNIQVISLKANTMKQDASVEELRAFAQGIRNLHGD